MSNSIVLIQKISIPTPRMVIGISEGVWGGGGGGVKLEIPIRGFKTK